MDSNTFDAVFWSFFITSTIGLIIGLSKMAYRSKCREVSCCCVKIIRDIDAEEKEFEFTQTHQTQSPTDNNNNLSSLNESKI